MNPDEEVVQSSGHGSRWKDVVEIPQWGRTVWNEEYRSGYKELKGQLLSTEKKDTGSFGTGVA